MEDKILEIIENFCRDGESFTSLDISNAIKINGFPQIRHRDVAPVVRQIYSDGNLLQFGYIRTLIDVELLGGLKTKTNLYHLPNVSTDLYITRNQIAIPPKKQDDNNVPIITTFSFNDSDNDNDNDDQNDNDDGQNDNEIECYCKSDGRLEIPVEWVRQIWPSGTTIYFSIDDDTIIINGGKPLEQIGECKIGNDGRLRVPKTIFMKAGFDYRQGAEHLVIRLTNSFEIKDNDV